MLTNEIIDQLRAFSDDEDASLWSQGDILNDNQITRDEVKRLAVILAQSPAKLRKRQYVAAQTPIENRHEGYSWNLYALFTNIADVEKRFQVLYSRQDWTLAEAREVVHSYSSRPVAEQNKLTHVERAALKVGNVTVKAKLNPKGELTLLVSLGGDRDVHITHQSLNTKIVFPA